VRLDGPAGQVFARTAELQRWGVLAPPMARLQVQLLGPQTSDVFLSVEELAVAVGIHDVSAAAAGGIRAAPTGGT
jgi:hypothetical protein